MRRLAPVVCSLALLAAVPGSAAAGSWADRDIRLVTADGLMGGDASHFRPDDPLTAGELSDLVAGLSGKKAVSAADPGATVTVAGLDSALVRAEGLSLAASELRASARAAGLAPPARFGTEVVARLLGLRTDHAQDSLELEPGDPATRAEAAFSAARILRWKGWETQYAQGLAAGFLPAPVEGWQQRILRQAVSLIGYPYVWGGTSELPQSPFGVEVPGGFDCSGFVWRLYKLAGYAVGSGLAQTIRGRTAAAMSGDVPRSERIGLSDLEPADLLFFGPFGPRTRSARIDHVGVYLGGGWLIHATGTGVSLSPLQGTWKARFAWARRPLAEAGL